MSDAFKSEAEILEMLHRFFPNTHASLTLGRGDDCAELAVQSPLALSTDLFLEGVHFRRSYFTLREIGRKALTVNLSDLGAAGAEPLGFSLGLMLPSGFTRAEGAELFGGMSALAAQFDLALSGGDLSLASDGHSLGFCLTVWGGAGRDAAWAGQGAGWPFLRRGQAEAGDIIFVGHPQGLQCLGLAAAGLRIMEVRGRAALAEFPQACAAHLAPEPQTVMGLRLAAFSAQGGRPLGLMDLSDGLARDLPRLLNAGRQPTEALGACLQLEAADLHPELGGVERSLLVEGNCAAGPERLIGLALQGGEEYALLGVCPRERWVDLSNAMPVLCFLGEAGAQNVFVCNDHPLEHFAPQGGFDHFSA